MFPVGATSDLVSYCAWGSSRGANAYFAVAGYTVGPDGEARRTAACARWHRCLRLDIDVGATKPYKERREALVALLQFVERYRLPQPWIVDSGGGFHAYFAFDRDVTIDEWVPMAGRLRAACEEFGLQCDHTTTIDAARILRLPGTLNNKPEYVATGNPPMVRILQAGVATDPALVVAHLPHAAPLYTNAFVPAALRGRASELQANLHQPYFLRDTLKQCPGLLAMLGDGGARAPEPLWKATLDLINKADDPEEVKVRVARALSAGHHGFTEEGFARKWQQVKQQNYHPPTCSRMAAAGMAECASCPLRGRISSPLVLGRPVAVPPASTPVMPPPAPTADPPAVAPPSPSPAGGPAPVAAPVTSIRAGVFEIDASSVVRVHDGLLSSRIRIHEGKPCELIEEDQPDGTKQARLRRLLDYKLLSVERMLDVQNARSVIVLAFEAEQDGVVKVEFDNKDFAEPKSFHNKMFAAGLYAKKRNVTDFVDKFMTEFLSSLQRARAASQLASRCGWTDDFEAFVLGKTLYRRDGSTETIRAAIAAAEIEGYHSAGDEAAWREAFNIALHGGVDRQCVLALALAGPLMPFTGLDGVMLNAYSPESGVGKSTLCDAALSIWGSPNVLRKDFRDTANATFKLASVMGNMPMVVDEFTNVEGKALSDYVYTITQGREKHRLTSDAKIAQSAGQRWCLAAIATSNNSIHEKLQDFRRDATAEAARVFEMRLHPLNLPTHELGAVKQKLMALRHCYGFLGPTLVRLFLSRPADYWREAVMSRVAKWDREASTSAGDRFRSAVCALIEVGAALGKALGFDFDPAACERELRYHWTKQVSEFEAERKKPIDFVTGYVLEHLSDMVLLTQHHQIINAQTPRRLMGEIRGTASPGEGFKPRTVMIPLELLRDYVREQKGNFKAVQEWLQSSPATLRMGRLHFLDGTLHAMVTPAVEFRHADIIGANKPQLSVVHRTTEVTTHARPHHADHHT